MRINTSKRYGRSKRKMTMQMENVNIFVGW